MELGAFILLGVGLVFIVLEVFFPSFGILGTIAAGCIITGGVLAYQTEGATFVSYLALAFVLGLIGLIAWLARRSGFVVRPTLPRSFSGPGRLAVSEVHAVDAKRRLVLVRRDDTEHLLLFGASGEVVIERGIPVPEGRSE